MEDANLLLESVKFMMLGMTVVFTFLILLIIVVNLQAKIVAKLFPEKATKPVKTAQNNETEHVAAIIAAVTEFRKKS
ncbi:MAG: Na+-transporting oxaloacetate decarboxylase subunit gamma [Epsilonproteobacteria bacterium]|nr:MAG: Na+-transporting oxaloacetate decarboxylase subunit gamma [Campylobacterota bacterium]